MNKQDLSSDLETLLGILVACAMVSLANQFSQNSFSIYIFYCTAIILIFGEVYMMFMIIKKLKGGYD